MVKFSDGQNLFLGPIQLAFNSRIRTYQAWQSADAEVRRVKQNNERARGHARIPVVSLNVLAEVRSKLVRYLSLLLLMWTG
jgi:hypothetical protein